MSGTKLRKNMSTLPRVHGSYRSKLLQHTIFVGGVVALAFSPVMTKTAAAQTVQFGNVTVTLQSTLGYTLGERTAPVDNSTASLNVDDGDRNFKSGIVANRFQTLEQLGIVDGDYGFRASALAYIDTVYLQDSKNTSPDTFNSYGIGPKGFPSATIANEGRRIEPLAAFLYGAEYFNNGNDKLSWQVGRQIITWGEALFTLNGIAGLQAPVDAYQGELLPNPQAQALFLPTGAAQVSYNFANGASIDGYWQFEYEPDILPGVGSYFSPADIIGPGAQRILATPVSLGAVSIYRAPDIKPSNGLNQFGLSAHYTVDNNYGLGVYFVRGIPKGPIVYTNIGGFVPLPTGPQIGVYNIAYAKPVNAFAASLTTLIGAANVAAEVDDFLDTPLASTVAYSAADPATYSHPLYTEGNVFNAALNAIYLTPPLLGQVFANGITLTGETTFNHVISIVKNKPALTPGNNPYGAALEITATPNWFPRADVEIEVPVGWTTTFLGDSQYTQSNAGTSTYDIGIKAIYKTNLTLGLNYQRYAGPPNRQGNIDRDFATFYVQDTF